MNCSKYSILRDDLVFNDRAQNLNHIRAIAASCACILSEEGTMNEGCILRLRVLHCRRNRNIYRLHDIKTVVIRTLVECGHCTIVCIELIFTHLCSGELSVSKNHLIIVLVIYQGLGCDILTVIHDLESGRILAVCLDHILVGHKLQSVSLRLHLLAGEEHHCRCEQ